MLPEIMSELPTTLLLLDSSALLVSKTREWQEFSRVGRCFIPQAVYEEMQALSNVSVERKQEQTAREFNRFFADSEWQLTGAGATHPVLQPTAGQAYSKRARLALTVAECAHGFSRNNPGRVVVLVANDQALLQRVRDLGLANLCGIPVSALLIWSRSGRRPPVVAQHMQAMRSTTVAVSSPTSPRRLDTAVKSVSRSATRTRAAEPKVGSLYSSNHPSALYQIASGLSALAAAVLAIAIVWYIAQPKNFNQFMRQMKLPTLPEISSSAN